MVAGFVADNLRADGIEVAVAYNCASALLALSNYTPDLILLDWFLPDTTPEAIIKVACEGGSPIPVVVITAGMPSADEIKALPLLTKPFKMEALWDTLKKYLPGQTGETRAEENRSE